MVSTIATRRIEFSTCMRATLIVFVLLSGRQLFAQTDSYVAPRSSITVQEPSELDRQANPNTDSNASNSDAATELAGDDNADGDGQNKEKPPTPAEEQKKAQEALKKKVAGAYKPLFFDNDFSYLCDPNYKGWTLGENLKQLSPLGHGCIDFGGQYRFRAQFERNMYGLGLTGVDNDFLLHRLRLYGDWQVGPNVRLYGEIINADSTNGDFAPRPIDVNHFDMLNVFFDARLLSGQDSDLTLRVGRQELMYGAQREVSPLDWANTRRTFDGIKLMWDGPNWKTDAFWTNPVFPDDNSFDSPDRDREFMGLWSTYKGQPGQTTDIYFLRYLNGAGTNDFKFNTLGFRRKGDTRGLLWEMQAGYQFGTNTNGSDHAAGMTTIGLGKSWASRCWKPTAWLYYDYASGDQLLGAGNGYDHMFPLAHKYLGFMDLFGRNNIEDVNLLCTLQPTQKLKLLAWYHYLFLATQSDTPYSVVMTPFNPGNQPGSPSLGHELDLMATWTFTPRQNLVLGYSHFFSGNYYQTTPGVPFTGNADFFYTQWVINF